MSYREALHAVLEAVRSGEDIETAIGRYPEHADDLRADSTLAEAVGRVALRVPPPPPHARSDAAGRMLAQLRQERAASRSSAEGDFRIRDARFAFALAAVAVAVVLGGLLLLKPAGSSVEAATIEGVVIGNGDGRLTLQTVKGLEAVSVPSDTPVSDAVGAPIDLAVVGVGQVVVVDADRRDGVAIARRVERYMESIEAWCEGHLERCRALAIRLERAGRECQDADRVCDVAVELLEQLRVRAALAARLEGLKQACRGGRAQACRQLRVFCRETDGCGDLSPQPGNTDAADTPGAPSCGEGGSQACPAGPCGQEPRACERDMVPSPQDTRETRPAPSTREVAPESRATPGATPAAHNAAPSPVATPRPVRPVVSPEPVVPTPVSRVPADSAPSTARDGKADETFDQRDEDTPATIEPAPVGEETSAPARDDPEPIADRRKAP